MLCCKPLNLNMSAEFKFPNEIDPLGTNLNRATDFQRIPLGKQKQITVRIGEILRGKIVEVISPQQAVISLPNGTFTAEISGRFKAGDELFFRVQKVEPSLVLKIHSMFVGKGNWEIATNEILRILDLPKNNLFEKIIDYEKSKSNIIVREEVILKAKFSSAILEKIPKENLNLLLRFVDFALNNNLEPTMELFEHYKGMFSIKDLIPKIVTLLQANQALLPPDIKNQMQNFRNLLQLNQPIPNLLKNFSPNFIHNPDNLFNFLLNLKNFDFPNEMKIPLEDLYKAFNSFWVINASASFSYANFIYLVVPYIWERNFRYTFVLYRKRKQGTTEEQYYYFEDEEIIKPVKENLEHELRNFFSKNEGRNDFILLQKSFQKNSQKETSRLIIKSPTGFTQLIRLLPSHGESTTGVSIVI